jgi:hypothetical protein
MSLYNKPVMLLCEIVLHMLVAVILLEGVSANVSLWLSAVIFVKNAYLEISWNPYFSALQYWIISLDCECVKQSTIMNEQSLFRTTVANLNWYSQNFLKSYGKPFCIKIGTGRCVCRRQLHTWVPSIWNAP